MSDAHDGHDHDDAHALIEEGEGLSYYAKRARAMEALLQEKGLCTPEEVQRAVDTVESRSPADGAKVVARAWTDSGFKERLLADPRSALDELGYTLPDANTQLAVLENTEDVHYLVVCTLCSCYPRNLLGRPPDWYKSLAYRSRAVIDPRGVMREFGLEVPEDVEVRVMDSTAELRYLVLPRRPAGTDGLSEEELAKLVNRDSMIGVTEPLVPETVAAD